MWQVFSESEISWLYGLARWPVEKAFMICSKGRALTATQIEDHCGEYQRENQLARFTLPFTISLNQLFDYRLDVVKLRVTKQSICRRWFVRAFCQLTVYLSQLMREWRHHCQKIATRDRILSGGNSGWRRKQRVRRSWSMWGSNSRPWRYQLHALPTELTDQDDGPSLVCRPSNSTLIELEECLFWGAGGKGINLQ